MSILSLVYAPSKILEEKAASVKNINNKVKKLVSNMFDTMYENNGVGLAAPQVNESLQILGLIVLIKTMNLTESINKSCH